ncbi:hypothetical protein SAMN05216289_10618 [Dokdonella immobilis]|uniref:Uncharacterized protein n=1 Tax=Dokdonella immobilis TaxID=578942 RepID=A0A1I4WTK9_9GAMM|nr:hypothetical protein SAMN05216289_10618 [Dokdonella immobilis]
MPCGVGPARGALLPHRFTLTTHDRGDPENRMRRHRSAVCFLLHFPSTHVAQALPGTLPCGARTFLAVPKHVATAWPTPARSVQRRGLLRPDSRQRCKAGSHDAIDSSQRVHPWTGNARERTVGCTGRSRIAGFLGSQSVAWRLLTCWQGRSMGTTPCCCICPCVGRPSRHPSPVSNIQAFRKRKRPIPREARIGPRELPPNTRIDHGIRQRNR